MTDPVFLLFTSISNKFLLPEFASFYGRLPVSELCFVKSLGRDLRRNGLYQLRRIEGTFCGFEL